MRLTSLIASLIASHRFARRSTVDDPNVHEVMLTETVWDEINDHKNGNNGCFGHYNEVGHSKVAADLAPKIHEVVAF